MRRSPLTLLAVASLALAFAPVGAAEHDAAGYHQDPTDPASRFFVESEAWFTATSTVVGNVANEAGEWIGWSDVAPTGPGGGATVATAVSGFRSLVDDQGQDYGQFTAEGTVTGYVDSITLDLYAVAPFQSLCPLNLAVDVDIDGIPVLDMAGIGGSIRVAADGPADSTHYLLKITDIVELLEGYSSSGFDFVGDPDTEHVVSLSVQQYPLCNEVVWRYGASDAPAAIRFNHDPSAPDVAVYTEFSATNPPAAD